LGVLITFPDGSRSRNAVPPVAISFPLVTYITSPGCGVGISKYFGGSSGLACLSHEPGTQMYVIVLMNSSFADSPVSVAGRKEAY
jgi:hypothetical protein